MFGPGFKIRSVPKLGPEPPNQACSFGLHMFTQNREMREVTLGQPTQHYFTHFPAPLQETCKRHIRNGAKKKVLESAGLVGTDLAVL